MSLRAKEVSEQLSVKQWLGVCSAVDERMKSRQKFDVISIKRLDGKVVVLVCSEGGILHTIDVAA